MVVMESWVFSQGRKMGEQEMLVRLCERRLRRALAEDERAALLGRISTLGFDRIGDALFDLGPEALAAWLHDPDVT